MNNDKNKRNLEFRDPFSESDRSQANPTNKLILRAKLSNSD